MILQGVVPQQKIKELLSDFNFANLMKLLYDVEHVLCCLPDQHPDTIVVR